MSRPLILFVDDDPSILDGLKTGLEPDSVRWKLRFADSGEAALEIFGNCIVDVVVCDLRMPRIDGTAVLSTVRSRYPSTVRIVLSGHTEDELTLESLHATHRFLAKPVQIDVVREAIERSLMLRESLRNKALVKVMSGLESVPALPQIYDELMAALASEHSRAAQIGAIVESDVGLSATILKLVNSSFYGLFRHIASPAEAVALLGAELVKNIALTEKLFSQFEGDAIDLDYFIDLNRQSNLSGLMATHFARSAGIARRSTDHCQIAALLARLGDLLIKARLGDHPMVADGTLDASLVGGYILELWNLPDPVVDAVTYQQCRPPFTNDLVTPTHVLHAIRYLQANLTPGESPADTDREALLDALSGFLPAQLAAEWLAIYSGWQNGRKARAA